MKLSPASPGPLWFLACVFTVLPLLTASAADNLPRLAQELGAQWDAEKGSISKKNRKPPLTAEAVQRLLNCPEVKALQLHGVAVDVETAKVIGQSTHLETLVTSHVDFVGGVDFPSEFAKVKSLTDLAVCWHFGDEWLEALSALSNLRRLRMAHVSRDPDLPITRPGMKAISKHGSLVSFSVSIMHQAH
jgi:hypothetical protein